VFHISDFPCTFVDHRLRRPTGDETGRDHSAPQAHTAGVPHVRTSVRGLINTGRSPIKGLSSSRCPNTELGCPRPRFPVEFRGFPALHAPFLKRKAHTRSCPELRTGNSGHLGRFLRDVGLPQNFHLSASLALTSAIEIVSG